MTLLRRFLIAVAVISVTSTAQAQGTAEALFAEGVELMKARSYAEAALKFEASLAVEDRASTQFMLAQCYEKTERPASAWSLYCGVSAAADAQADEIAEPSRAQAKRELAQKARIRAAPLLPGVSPMARVDLSPEAARIPGITVTLDKKALELSGGGAWAYVNGREHTVTAEAKGRKPWSMKFRPSSVCDTPHVTIPELIEDPRAKPLPKPVPDEELDHSGTLTLVTIGAMSLALGAVTGLRAVALNNDFLSRCPDRACQGSIGENSSIDRLVSNRDLESTMSTAGFIVGGTAIAGAIVREIIIRSGHSSRSGQPSSRSAGIAIAPLASITGPDARGWILHGVF